jgi:hypothetical protein
MKKKLQTIVDQFHALPNARPELASLLLGNYIEHMTFSVLGAAAVYPFVRYCL